MNRFAVLVKRLVTDYKKDNVVDKLKIQSTILKSNTKQRIPYNWKLRQSPLSNREIGIQIQKISQDQEPLERTCSSVGVNKRTSSFVENIYRQFCSNFFTLDWKLDIYLSGFILLLIMFACICAGRKFKCCGIEVPAVIPPSSKSEVIYKCVKALKCKGIILKHKTSEDSTILAKSVPNFVVVVNQYSRLETDVSNALADIRETDYRQVVLLIVHCVPKAELPRDSSNAKLRQDDKYREIAEIIDIAYYKPHGIFSRCRCGIYNCKMNKEAIETLCHTFHTHTC